jgi:hypothetical protein
MICGIDVDPLKTMIKSEFYLNTQSAPRSKHTPSRL